MDDKGRGSVVSLVWVGGEADACLECQAVLWPVRRACGERPKRAQLTAPASAMTPLRCLPSPVTPLIEAPKLKLDALKSEFEAFT